MHELAVDVDPSPPEVGDTVVAALPAIAARGRLTSA